MSLALLCGLSTIAGAAPAAADGASAGSDDHQEAAIVRYLHMTYPAAKGLRLYYRAQDCSRLPARYLLPLPSGFDPGGEGGVAVALPGATVEPMDERGVVRVWWGDVPRAVLDARIERLQLDDAARFNADEAVDALQLAPEARSLGIEADEPSSFIKLLTLPSPKHPHLPTVLRQTTIDRVLDVIAVTFHGAVLSGACGNRAIYRSAFVTW